MKSGFPLALLVLLAASCAFTMSLGCSNQTDIHSVYDANIKRLHACYMMFMEDNSYQGPKDEAEFKNYLKTNPTAIFLMKRIDLTPENVDEIFVGERDSEPFVVRYGLKGVADHAIVFEAVGVDGKRLVALSNPIECGDEDYDSYLSGKLEPETAPTGGDEFETGIE